MREIHETGAMVVRVDSQLVLSVPPFSLSHSACPGRVISGSSDLTPRRGLVYDAVLVSTVLVYSSKEECDVAGDALKVEDATWDAEVMKSSELVMVDFWAVWCGPCQMVAPVIEELSKEYAGKMKVRKLNTDENPEVAGRYQVMSIPTILFFKNGQVVEKLVGARPKRQFKEMIDSLLAQPAGSA
jgi:thioredoxin 1